MNRRYKGEQGVYNTADECFVASRIFFDGDYRRLHCVCSPNQIQRKKLFYIAFGVIPYAMRERGIPTLVWLSPILPYLNDTEENVRSILEACIRTGVKGVLCFGMGLTLREGDREYYYAALDRHFPGLKRRYIECYGNAYEVPSPHAAGLWELFETICRENGLLYTPEDCFRYLYDFPEKHAQLSLFDTAEEP